MPVHCFRVDATPGAGWTATHTTNAKAKVKKFYLAFGKEQMPKDAVDFEVKTIDGVKSGLLIMRLPIVPGISIDEIKAHIVDLLDHPDIDSWTLKYHLCMNPERRPCHKWEVLATG